MKSEKIALFAAACASAIVAYGQESQSVGDAEPLFILDEFQVTAMDVLAARAIPGLTPVAFSTIDETDISKRLASQDLPLALNVTPSVYSTNEGGGPGDARINVRGFSQRNVAIMVNGVPVNDMENGWVYWSNWDGIGDVASSIQVQRGMSNLNLAVPSIGGTLNILTKPAAHEFGGLARLEIGSDGFTKSTIVGHTGLVNDKFAASAALIRKVGDSYVDGVWTDAWAWFFGAYYKANEYNTFEFYALGAPQQHGQNLYERNIGTYSKAYALSLSDYDPQALSRYYQRGFAYNETWNYVDESYDGQQFDGSLGPRKFSDRIGERVNFFHKPQVNLNWYYTPDADWRLDSVIYYSGGEGGGSGTLGSVARVSDPGGYFNRNRDWNAEIAQNRANLDSNGEAKSTGILRNSRNNQWTIGAVSKLTYEVNEAVDLSAGVDWRTAEIEHYREVRDLLGGDYYIPYSDDSSAFWTGDENKRRLGDKVGYDFTNTVDWLGTYVQGQYDKDAFSAFAMTGYSRISYRSENYFMEDLNNPGQIRILDPGSFDGVQVKGGVLYRASQTVNLYANAGYVDKVPIVDAVMNDEEGYLQENTQNEEFKSFEVGINYLNKAGTLAISANFYSTNWRDRTFTQEREDQTTGEDIDIVLSGVGQDHSGFELEAKWQVSDFLRFDLAISKNDWAYSGDVDAVFNPESGPAEDYRLYIDGLKVGDAPQTQFVFRTTVTPVSGLSIELVNRHNTDFYADFDPATRTDETDRAQSWEIPDFWIHDLHFYYTLPISASYEVSMFLHVLNITGEVYIQDATDNDQYNSFDKDHDADDAAVHFGAPRRFNTGVSVKF